MMRKNNERMITAEERLTIRKRCSEAVDSLSFSIPNYKVIEILDTLDEMEAQRNGALWCAQGIAQGIAEAFHAAAEESRKAL